MSISRTSVESVAGKNTASATKVGRRTWLDGLELLGVDDRDVVDAAGSEGLIGVGDQQGRVALTGVEPALDGREEPGDRERGLASVGPEPSVAAGQREAVGLAHRRHADDLAGQEQISVHAPDDRELLEVLLPERDEVGREQLPQLADDRAHTLEVAGPGGPAQVLVEAVRR